MKSPTRPDGKDDSEAPTTGDTDLSMDEDAIYESIYNELENDAINRGLWTRLYAASDGDEVKTKVAYINERAAQLIEIEKERLRQKEELEEEEQRLIREEQEEEEAVAARSEAWRQRLIREELEEKQAKEAEQARRKKPLSREELEEAEKERLHQNKKIAKKWQPK